MKKVRKIHGFVAKALITAYFLLLPLSSIQILANDGPELPLSSIKKLQNTEASVDFSQSESAVTEKVPSNSALSQQTDFMEAPNYDEILKQRKIHTESLLDRIKQEIESSQTELEQINQDMIDTTEKLNSTHENVLSLQNQIDQLDAEILRNEELVKSVTKQIEIKQTEIRELSHKIEVSKIEVSKQKRIFMDYLELIYKKQNDFNTISSEGEELNTLKLLFGDDTAGETLMSLRYSEIFEDQGRQIIDKLQAMLEAYTADQQVLQIKKWTLTKLQKSLEENRVEIENDKQSKQDLLEQTQGQEKLFQDLLMASQKQQEESQVEIDTYNKNLRFIQDRMKVLGSDFNPSDYAGLVDIASQIEIYKFLNTPGQKEFNPLWPVAPLRGLSAFFHDTSYKAHFGFDHNAVDIPTPQATPIRAPADGVVYKAKDNGYGYSYLMIAHRDGYMTLYGHVYQFLVKEGDVVNAGEIIALSGGAPGSKGAGVYTTGAHLHFEIIKDNEHVDPLFYLNLAYVNPTTLPELYLTKALADQKSTAIESSKPKVKRVSVKKVE